MLYLRLLFVIGISYFATVSGSNIRSSARFVLRQVAELRTSCHLARERISDRNAELREKYGNAWRDYIPAHFIPRCVIGHDWQPVQCLETRQGVKQCWCVNSNGYKLPGTDIVTLKHGEEEPNCAETKSHKEIPTICDKKRKEYEELYEKHKETGTEVVSHWLPQCTADGHFKAMQCGTRKESHFCFCVDTKTGDPDWSTVKWGRGHHPFCSEGETKPKRRISEKPSWWS